MSKPNAESIGCNNVVIGLGSNSEHSSCVVIGTGLSTDHDFQLIIGNSKVSTSRRMTEGEFQELRECLIILINHNRRH